MDYKNNWKNKFDSVMCFIKITNGENLKPTDFILNGKWKIRFSVFA